MKEQFQSAIRHLVTAAVMIAATAIQAHVNTSDAAPAVEALHQVTEPVTLAISAGITVLFRVFLLPLLAQVPGLSILLGVSGVTKSGGSSSAAMLLIGCSCAALGMGSLVSCRAVTTTAPDGSVTTVRQVDQSAVTQGAGIIERSLSYFFPTQQTTAPTAVPVTNEK